METVRPVTNGDNVNQVNRMYMDTFGRQGDTGGVNYWVNELESGKNPNDVNNAFKFSAKKDYANYLTDPNSKWAQNPETNDLLKSGLSGAIQQGQGNSNWDSNYMLSKALKNNVNDGLHRGDQEYQNDPYGISDYNKTFGISAPHYAAGNPNGDVEKQNTLGTFSGNRILPSMDAFKQGINPQDIFAKAGLQTADGHYGGINNSWVAGHNDTIEEKQKRMQALTNAGMSEVDAFREADNGFQMAETDADINSRLMAEYIQKHGMENSRDVFNNYQATEKFQLPQPQQQQQQLQPFQQTQQYQNYMSGGYGQSQQNMQQPQQNFQQPRTQLQSFQPQQQIQQGGLLGNSTQPQQNQYGLLSPYATR